MDGLFKSEYPPLLADGLHPMTMSALRELCLTKFPSSTTRLAIMQGLEDAVKKLGEVGVAGDLWVNGSFLTEKIDPEDVDLTLRVDVAFIDNLTPKQLAVINWFATPEEARMTHYCHGFVWVDYPASHALSAKGEALRAYWLKQFGRSRSNEQKGIAVVQLPQDAT
jgi:hypothetical protein